MNSSANIFDLTSSQELIWIGQQINPQSTLYNMAMYFEFDQKIVVNQFIESFNYVVKTQDALRTVFSIEGDKPYQKVLSDIHTDINYIDLSKQDDIEMTFSNWLENRKKIIFDLEKTTYDTALLKIKEDQFIWYINQHHLITDGLAFEILYNQVIDHYSKSIEEGKPVSSSLYSFKNYYDESILFKNKNLKYTKSENLIDQQLDQLPIFYGEKIEKKRINTKAYTGKFKIDGIQYKDLFELSQTKDFRAWTTNMSFFNILSTIFFLFIHKTSSTNQPTIGTPFHNRTKKEHKQILGLFIEILPFEIKIEKDDTLFDLFKKTRNASLNLFKSAHPEKVNLHKARSVNFIFNYLNIKFKPLFEQPVRTTWLQLGQIDPSHDIRFQIYNFDKEEELTFAYEINAELFHENHLKRIEKDFTKILKTLLDNPYSKISKITITDNEEDTFINQFEKSKNASHHSFIEKLKISFQKYHSEIAIVFNQHSITYKELDIESDKVCIYLRQQGLGQKNYVAIHTTRSPLYFYYVIGCIKAGTPFIPIPKDTPHFRFEQIKQVSQFSVELNEFTHKEISKIQHRPITWSGDKDEIIYAIFTSGTTGQPKGVKISNESLSFYLNFAEKKYETKDKIVAAFFTSIGFDLTITSTFIPLISGGEIIIFEDSHENEMDLSITEVVKNPLINWIKLTPSHLSLIQDGNINPKLEVMIVGGEQFNKQHIKSISIPNHTRIYNEYGPTEGTVGCIVKKLSLDESNTSHNFSIGQPIENSIAVVLKNEEKNKPSFNLIPNGLPGRLFIGGAQLSKGYLNNLELTNDKFIQFKHPQLTSTVTLYDTGDMVRMNKEGDLEFIGRYDNQIKIGGRRIEIEEIENTLLNIEEIDTCFIHYHEENSLHAYIGSSSPLKIEVIQEEIKSLLPYFMQPQKYFQINEVKLNLNGKLDKKLIIKEAHSLIEKNQKYQAPRNDFEKIVYQQWVSVLNLEQINIYEDFIRLGGNSLLAIQLISRINNSFRLKLPINTVFKYSTIEKMAYHIKDTITKLMNG